MPNYNGFSTINANKPRTSNPTPGINGGPGTITQNINPGRKYKLTDESLVVRDFINALNIPQGQKVGQPEYGTRLWDFIFEPNTSDVQQELEDEIKRIVATDPRLQLGYCKIYPQENGILAEIQVAVNPFNQAQVLSLFFNSRTNTASIQS